MAAHRYWRATAFESYGGGDLELSEFHLLSGGVRADAAATLTASPAADVYGVVADLQDDVLSTAARWAVQAVKGVTLQWDFGGSTSDVSEIQLAGASEWRFPLIVKIQWSDDSANWTTFRTFAGISWPGQAALTFISAGAGDPSFANVVSLLPMSGPNGSTTFSDIVASPWVASGAAQISTVNPLFGEGSASFDGSTSYLTNSSSDFDIGEISAATNLTIEFFLYQSSLSSGSIISHGLPGSGGSGIGGWRLYADGGKLMLAVSKNSTSVNPWHYAATTLSVVLVTDTWQHIALCIVNGVPKLYVRGAEKGTKLLGGNAIFATSIIGFDTTKLSYGVRVGADFTDSANPTVSGYLRAQIKGVRITENEARYLSDFTPPSSSFATSPPPSIPLNTVRGRSASIDAGTIYGAPPPDLYGASKIAHPDYFGIESGSVKDQITGVLGEGIGRVKGTVALAIKNSPGQPVHRKVRLIRERDGLVIREAWSNAATGEYDFQYVDEAQTYTVVSYDHLHNYRAVIADNLVPELMP